MTDFIKQFSGTAEWVPLILAFIALPAFYVYLAIEVHKEYAEAVRFGVDKKILTLENKDRQVELLQEHVSIFELDWWVVASTAVLLLMIAGLPALLQFPPTSVTTCSRDVILKSKEQLLDCEGQISILRLYCLMVGISIAFRLGWARVSAVRGLRAFYLGCVV